MPVFARSFAMETLVKWDADKPGNAVRLLFDRWALPGQKTTSEVPLRLGLRDGYVNFYVKGQSVAKLSCGRDGPKLSVHNAYVAGYARGSERDGTLQSYEDYNAKALGDSVTATLVAGWIETAVTYASAEKRFVDDLVAANPGIIDLEMGLPASDLPGSERVAPRMDLVIVQVADDAFPIIAFWEAKCANNGELRASDDNAPKVLGQVDRYVRWMSENGRVAQVQEAYRNTAATLIKFYHLFRGQEGDVPECVQLWKALAATEAPAIIVQPGIVIGNYWPEGSTEGIASGRMAQSAASFARNKHREKIEQHGIHVHEVGPNHKGAALPLLSTGTVSA